MTNPMVYRRGKNNGGLLGMLGRSAENEN